MMRQLSQFPLLLGFHYTCQVSSTAGGYCLTLYSKRHTTFISMLILDGGYPRERPL